MSLTTTMSLKRQRREADGVAKDPLTIQARITPAVFREFALYDTLIRQKRWRGLGLFAAIMAGFGVVCFLMRGIREQAVFLGCVLLAVGITLPFAYFLSFLLSIRAQSRQMRLKNAPVAYTLTLSEEKIEVAAGGKTTEYKWSDVVYVRRLMHSTALYVGPQQAYLLPVKGQDKDRLRELVRDHVQVK